MTYLLIVSAVTTALAGGSRLVAMALRDGHLLALRGSGGERTLYERDADGRYAGVSWIQLPAALRRYVCGVPAAARARARGTHGR